MSDNLQAFIAHLQNTPELKAQVAALRQEPTDQTLQTLIRLSEQSGYPVTAEEWIAAGRQSSDHALEDRELEQIAGGWVTITIFDTDINLPLFPKQVQKH